MHQQRPEDIKKKKKKKPHKKEGVDPRIKATHTTEARKQPPTIKRKKKRENRYTYKITNGQTEGPSPPKR